MASQVPATGEILRLNNGESGFPLSLASIPSAPEVLYLRGRLPGQPRVALVGSRKADDYGLELARKLGADLAAAGLCVVSGGAGGVDTAALEGCLQAGGRPVAVLGTGVDVAYPAANRALFERVAGCGALVSEYSEGTPGHPGNFPRRNRLISGLSLGVVVVQAAEKSGSLITARDAARQGRLLMAVPGPAGSPLSAGVHRLIRQGARLVECAADVLEVLSIDEQRGLDLPPAREVTRELSQNHKMIWEALKSAPGAIDEITRLTGLESSQVASMLLEMELKGLVVQKPGMIYSRASNVNIGSEG